ncbi:hypothetical protein prwr041_18780 [Prevotella herbatica]|uniref:Uncharacterized protein n=1 Tax=Prevotella herbatica TaxID=2801997 RepID=A0ABM7NZQ5_9BACT|nr:hypothetical protein prwr041_18780 [Prevotella herbatica]
MYYRICECLNNAKKLSGSGDLGADYPLCFDSSENRKILQTQTCSLSDKLPLYISVTNNVLEGGNGFFCVCRV